MLDSTCKPCPLLRVNLFVGYPALAPGRMLSVSYAVGLLLSHFMDRR